MAELLIIVINVFHPLGSNNDGSPVDVDARVGVAVADGEENVRADGNAASPDFFLAGGYCAAAVRGDPSRNRGMVPFGPGVASLYVRNNYTPIRHVIQARGEAETQILSRRKRTPGLTNGRGSSRNSTSAPFLVSRRMNTLT